MTDEAQAHWLLRLAPRAWLSAAAAELAAGEDRVAERRSAVTHARRAAGMAMNAVLGALEPSLGLEAVEARWGRSYLDHLRAIAGGDPALRAPLPERAAAEAAALLVIPPVAAGERLIQLGARPHAAAHAALAHARALLELCAEALAALEAGAPPG